MMTLGVIEFEEICAACNGTRKESAKIQWPNQPCNVCLGVGTTPTQSGRNLQEFLKKYR